MLNVIDIGPTPLETILSLSFKTIVYPTDFPSTLFAFE